MPQCGALIGKATLRHRKMSPNLVSFERPAWSTGILIPASFLCGIFSAIFIAWGGKKTKRTEKVEEKLRAVLATEKSQPIPSASPGSPGRSVRGTRQDTGNDELILKTAIDEHMTVPTAEKG